MTIAVARAFHAAFAVAAERRGLPAETGWADLARQAGVLAWIDRMLAPPDAGPPWLDRAERTLRRLSYTLAMDAAAAVSVALTDAGIPHVFFKGAGLVGRIYEPGDRDLADLDVLIPGARRAQGTEVLRELGYVPTAAAARGFPARMLRGLEFEPREMPPEVAAVGVDLEWAAAPVTHLLSYADTGCLAPLWDADAVDRSGPLPAPRPGLHAALIVHHLVRHDFLHLRAALDLALLATRLTTEDLAACESLAARLRVRHAMRAALATVVVERRAALPRPTGWRARRLVRRLQLPDWIDWALAADQGDRERITPARLRRRLLAVDGVAVPFTLARDVLAPPADYLRWRWPEAGSLLGAWWRHARRVAGKAAG